MCDQPVLCVSRFFFKKKKTKKINLYNYQGSVHIYSLANISSHLPYLTNCLTIISESKANRYLGEKEYKRSLTLTSGSVQGFLISQKLKKFGFCKESRLDMGHRKCKLT